jgi:hypothetical protein
MIAPAKKQFKAFRTGISSLRYISPGFQGRTILRMGHPVVNECDWHFASQVLSSAPFSSSADQHGWEACDHHTAMGCLIEHAGSGQATDQDSGRTFRNQVWGPAQTHISVTRAARQLTPLGNPR